MSEESARLRAENLEVFSHDAPTLQAEWEGVLEELSGFSAKVESLGQGRVLLYLNKPQAQQLAEAYGARTGLADARQPALLAALAAFEGKVRVVEQGQEQAFMKQLPMRFTRGLGLSEDAVRKLHFLGINHLGDLLTWRPPQLEAFLGKEAKCLLPYLFGPWSGNVSLYQAPPKLEVSYEFEDAVTEPTEVTPVLELLSRLVADSLGERTAGRLTLTVTAQGLRFNSSRLAKEALSTPGSISRLAQLALGDSKAQALGIDTFILTLSGLMRPSLQGSLWRAREERQKAIRMVTARFPGALLSFREADPFTTARDKRFIKQRLDTHEVIREEATREEVTDAPGPATHPSQEQPPREPAVAHVAKAGA